jgi:hypothetical protein
MNNETVIYPQISYFLGGNVMVEMGRWGLLLMVVAAAALALVASVILPTVAPFREGPRCEARGVFYNNVLAGGTELEWACTPLEEVTAPATHFMVSVERLIDPLIEVRLRNGTLVLVRNATLQIPLAEKEAVAMVKARGLAPQASTEVTFRVRAIGKAYEWVRTETYEVRPRELLDMLRRCDEQYSLYKTLAIILTPATVGLTALCLWLWRRLQEAAGGL